MILYIQKTNRFIEKIRAGSGQTCPWSRELPSRLLGKVSNSLTRRPQQVNTYRIPGRALYRSLRRGGCPGRVRAELDGPIWDYIIDGRLPDDPKEAAKIRTRSARFTNHKGSLYKRGFFTPILKCIAGKDTEYVLREVHEGICGNHIGARALAGKVLRQGYYWPTILKDATDLVKKCKICQEHAKTSRLPSEPLTSITSLWPFQQWGLDILGPLPLGKGQCKFIIVVVDYFTKWAEVEPLATITE